MKIVGASGRLLAIGRNCRGIGRRSAADSQHGVVSATQCLPTQSHRGNFSHSCRLGSSSNQFSACVGCRLVHSSGGWTPRKVFQTRPGKFRFAGSSIGGHTYFAGVGWLCCPFRTFDPFMLDHMLSNCGFGTTDSATTFIKKYNQQVFYDEQLMLKDQAAQRAAKLLDPLRCPQAYKEAMRAAVPFVRLPSWHRQHIRGGTVDACRLHVHQIKSCQ